MDAQVILLVLLRAAHLLALASLFGTLTTLLLVAPAGLRFAPDDGAAAQRPLLALGRWSLVMALASGAAWLLLQSAAIAGATSVGAALTSLPVVLRDTQFGHFLALRLVLLLLAWPLLRLTPRRLIAVTTLCGIALALQVAIGHAGATGGSTGTMLMISEALHLLAAGAWLGALLPLFLLTRALPTAGGAATLHSFSPIGMSAVLVIACTALLQSWVLIGGIGGLFGTRYGMIALAKLGLFLVLLLCAAFNRLVLLGKLRDRDPPAQHWMLLSLGIEAGLGTVVIIVAALLASTTPATHETPIWPFARQPSLELLADPFARALMLRALLPSLAAAALLVASRFWRRLFWPALVALGVCLALAWPNLLPLLSTEAYPTSFVTSPTEFATGSIMRGAALFATNCVTCHGADARGDGPAAQSLPIPPADLTAAHFWGHSEGDLYWFISHGIEASPGVLAMPAFAGTLSSGNRWALIDFLQANNAGASMRATGRWEHPIPLPQFDAICADGSAVNLDDLRGRVVHLIAAAPSALPSATGDAAKSNINPPAAADAATIVLARDHVVKPQGAACVTVEPSTWDAFALLLGVTPDALPGTEALADQNGWLRQRWRPGDRPDWHDPTVLSAAIRDIVAHPLIAAGGGHAHHH